MSEFGFLVGEAVGKGASFADVRLVSSRSVVAEAKDGELSRATSGVESGLAVRVLVGGSWGFASSNRVASGGKSEARRVLAQALRIARALARRSADPVRLAEAPVVVDEVLWAPRGDPIGGLTGERVAGALRAVCEAARAVPKVASVRASFDARLVETVLENSFGSRIRQQVPRVLLEVNAVARAGGEVVGYRSRLGGTVGFEVFADDAVEAKGREAGEGAARLLTARPCPSGKMYVIADPDLTGVFAHEAIGHACEADLVIAGESLLGGRIGEQVGVDELSIVDDGGVEGGYGSAPYDDEGTRGSRKELVTRGVLTGYIHSLETAGRLDMRPNGGARAESGSSRPLVRMSNTLVAAGDRSFEELLEGVKLGVLAKGTRGGQVDVAKGSFQFGAQEAWLIENGEVTTPLRDAALQGTILETLKRIDGIGKDARLASPGICGKGQWVPVGDGGPHIRIADAVVGGGG